ncbi:hypothetical protein Tco_0898819, partial [Tanacetum coccineum]
ISSLEDDDENVQTLNIERSKGDSDYDCTQQCKEEKKARATHTGKIENECQGLQASLFLHEYKQNFTGLQRYNPKIAGLAKHLAKDLIASIEEEIDGAGVTVSHDPEQDKLILSTKNEELINCLKEVSKLQHYPKWDAAEPIDGDNLQEVFGPDKRERPAGKQRAGKKQKSDETSGSTGGSQLESVLSLVSQDYRRKCDAAKRAYEAQKEKDLAIKKCEEMRFLMNDTSNLPPHKRAFIERQQAEIMRKYQDAGADD